MPTKPRVRVDAQYALPIAYQQMGMTTIVERVNDAIPISLVDDSVPPKEVNDDIGFHLFK